MKAQSLVNGVDVARLREFIERVRQDPSLGEFHFRLRNRWLDRGRNESELLEFYGAGSEVRRREFVAAGGVASTGAYVAFSDEPRVLLGDDTAPNPVEHLLHALAGCLTSTLVYHAAARGIQIEAIESELEGDIDVRGFLGIADDVPRGYERIRVTMRVRSSASPQRLAELAEYSPVYNTISSPVPVDVQIETHGD
jgi:uncharacterized OsmC-like protein